MPRLDVTCEQHGVSEIWVATKTLGSPAALATEMVCPVCFQPAKRKWSAPAVAVIDFRDGWDMGAGKYFSTKRERENWISSKGKRRVRD